MYPQRRNHRPQNPLSNRYGHLILSTLIIIILWHSPLLAQDSGSPGGLTTEQGNIFDFFGKVLEFLETTVEYIVAIFKNPLGFLNQCINYLIDLIDKILPTTPENLKISNLVNNLGESVPAVGTGIIRELLNTFSQLAGLALIIKIYKLIPFKAT